MYFLFFLKFIFFVENLVFYWLIIEFYLFLFKNLSGKFVDGMKFNFVYVGG